MKTENEKWEEWQGGDGNDTVIQAAQRDIEDLAKSLADALRPFAAMAIDIPTNRTSIGNLHESDILRAAAALQTYENVIAQPQTPAVNAASDNATHETRDVLDIATSHDPQWQIQTLRAMYNDAKTQRNELLADMLKISRTYLADAHRIADAALKKYKMV